MDSNIPVFEYSKDSYILKHKLEYNTSCSGDFENVDYGILFTDYSLARKTQSKNSENFDPIVITGVTSLSNIELTHYDESYSINLSVGRVYYDDTVLSGITFINNRRYQQYTIDDSGITSYFEPGDYFNIYFYVITGTTVTTTWEHFGPSGETWVATGETDNGIPYQITGTTTEDGYSTGTASMVVADDYHPVLKYRALALEIGTDYIKFERKLEDYIYNNLISTDGLMYRLESLNYTYSKPYNIKYILGETKWNNYFSFDTTDTELTITPIQNKEDLYFDYDNVKIITTETSGTTEYTFDTNCLYTKYKLDRFLQQFGYDSGTTIFYSGTSVTTSEPYNSEIQFDITLDDAEDAEFFLPYTYIYADTDANLTHICLIISISGSSITVLTPRMGMTNGEVVTSIMNMYSVEDVSKMLYECFINIESGILPYTSWDEGNVYDPSLEGYNVIEPEFEITLTSSALVIDAEFVIS